MNKIIFFFVIITMLGITASAVDNPVYLPMTIKPSYDSGYTMMTASNNATLGMVYMRTIGSDGYFASGNQRIYGGVNILATVSDPTSPATIGGQYRIFGTSEDGSVWYTDSPNLNYSTGFYDPGYMGCSIDGNCNDLRKIATLSAVTTQRPISVDSDGNVYTNDGRIIKRYVKAYSYSPETFYTVADCTGACARSLMDIEIDSENNIYLTYGDIYVNNPATLKYLNVDLLNPQGTLIRTITLNSTTFTLSANDGYYNAIVIPDSVNSTHNMTFAFMAKYAGVPKSYIYHHTDDVTTDIGGGQLTSITAIGGAYYENHQTYVAATPQNIIRSYITSYVGYAQSSVGGGSTAAPTLTYTTKTIGSVYTSYYNNSNIQITYNVNVDTGLFGSSILTAQNYKWKIDVIAPSGVVVASQFSPICTPSFFRTSCTTNATKQFSPPSVGWPNGTYTARLSEYSITTYRLATLTTSGNFMVLNGSFYGGSTAGDSPTTQPGSAVDSNEITNLLQNNSFWALIITVGIMLGIGAQAGKNGSNPLVPMIMAGFLGLAVTTLLNWIPAWVLFSVVLVVIAAIAWQFSRNSNTGGQ